MVTVLAALLAAHMVADYPLQTDWMAANKHDSWGALTAHVATHLLVTLALVALATRDVSLTVGLSVPVAFLHGLIDGLDLPLRWDQTVHLLVVSGIGMVILT